ncbi:MAG: hypothetical protein J6T83_02960, partial [Paludibacteraceae bacterium]|nr:hypothetical protein [Paludibacteraceae bacterium]
KKRLEMEMKERTFVYEGDIFQLPARIKKIDSTYVYGLFEDTSYTYTFNASDREAIKQHLFELTSKLSEYGNFDLNREKKFFRLGVTSLKDAKIDVSDDATRWYYVGSNGKIYYISFDENSEEPCFEISNGLWEIDENYIIQYLCLPLIPDIRFD